MQYYFALKIIQDKVILSSEDEHHILHVMRMKKDDQLIAIVAGVKYLCTILDDRKLSIGIKQIIQENAELSRHITLIYSMPKSDKFDLVLQKATELGVKKIVPLISERSLIKYDGNRQKIERWSRIIKEASEQSRRNCIPEIVEPITNEDIIHYISDMNILGNENFVSSSTQSLYDMLNATKGNITVLVGCEGGFSPSEIIKYEKLGFKSFSFGRRILRSETAAIYILSVISFMLEK